MKFLVLIILLLAVPLWADPRCPLADLPTPPVASVVFPDLLNALQHLKNQDGKEFLQITPETESELKEVFSGSRSISKLEQFFQLLYWIQKNVPDSGLPLTVRPPGITEVLLKARVFKTEVFPRKILSTTLREDDSMRPPLIQVQFDAPEARFPINEGVGFATWDQGKCQIVKDLVFTNGFSFRLRPARNSKNLIVDDFSGVDLFGDFGTRRIFKIDLQYVALEKVEFIQGTEEGKVTARVSPREFRANQHSRLFKFVGSLIPNTARQRIDW